MERLARMITLVAAGASRAGCAGDPQVVSADLAAAYGGPVTLDVEYVPTTRQQVEAVP